MTEHCEICGVEEDQHGYDHKYKGHIHELEIGIVQALGDLMELSEHGEVAGTVLIWLKPNGQVFWQKVLLNDPTAIGMVDIVKDGLVRALWHA